NPQGTGTMGTTSATVTAGQRTVANITIAGGGAVTGLVRTGRGAIAVGVLVQLEGDSFFRSTSTDTAGRYTFGDTPAGSYTVRAFEAHTDVPTSAAVTVVEDQSTTANLELVGLGIVEIQARFADGTSASGAFLEAFGDLFFDTAVTDAK